MLDLMTNANLDQVCAFLHSLHSPNMDKTRLRKARDRMGDEAAVLVDWITSLDIQDFHPPLKPASAKVIASWMDDGRESLAQIVAVTPTPLFQPTTILLQSIEHQACAEVIAFYEDNDRFHHNDPRQAHAWLGAWQMAKANVAPDPVGIAQHICNIAAHVSPDTTPAIRRGDKERCLQRLTLRQVLIGSGRTSP